MKFDVFGLTLLAFLPLVQCSDSEWIPLTSNKKLHQLVQASIDSLKESYSVAKGKSVFQSNDTKVAVKVENDILLGSFMGFAQKLEGNTILVTYRGTNIWNWKDLAADAEALITSVRGLPLTAHSGFARIASGSYDALVLALSQLVPKNESLNDYELVLSGHSMGGAVAILHAAMLYLDAEFGFQRQGGPRNRLNQIKIITYGSPMVFSWNSAFHFPLRNENHLRIIIERDPIPAVPGNIIGFQHCGVPLLIPREWTLKDWISPLADHSVASYEKYSPDYVKAFMQPKYVTDVPTCAKALSKMFSNSNQAIQCQASNDAAKVVCVTKHHLEILQYNLRSEEKKMEEKMSEVMVNSCTLSLIESRAQLVLSDPLVSAYMEGKPYFHSLQVTDSHHIGCLFAKVPSNRASFESPLMSLDLHSFLSLFALPHYPIPIQCEMIRKRHEMVNGAWALNMIQRWLDFPNHLRANEISEEVKAKTPITSAIHRYPRTHSTFNYKDQTYFKTCVSRAFSSDSYSLWTDCTNDLYRFTSRWCPRQCAIPDPQKESCSHVLSCLSESPEGFHYFIAASITPYKSFLGIPWTPSLVKPKSPVVLNDTPIQHFLRLIDRNDYYKDRVDVYLTVDQI